jgi:hypothetical protein
MGADFILAIVEKPQEEDKELWRTRIAALTVTDMEQLDADCCPLVPTEFDLSETDKPEALIREFADDLVDTIYELSWTHPGREATWLNLGDESYIASGGMSWGDSPTDTYDYIIAWDVVTELLIDRP